MKSLIAQLPRRLVQHGKDLARHGMKIVPIDAPTGEQPMSEDVRGLAKVINEELPKLVERARNLADGMRTNLDNINGSLAQAEDTNNMLTRAAMELQAALGRTSNMPPAGSRVNDDDKEG